MIKTTDIGIAISGTTTEILLEFIAIIHGIKNMLNRDLDEDLTRKIIADMGKMAFALDDPNVDLSEIAKSLSDELDAMVERKEKQE